VSKPPPRNLTPALCEHLRQKMLQSCKAIAEEHGLVIQGSPLHEVNLRYGFNFTIEVGIPMSDGTILEPGRALFEVLAGDFGLNASDFGREFRANGEAFRITGLSPRRPKYPRRRTVVGPRPVQVYRRECRALSAGLKQLTSKPSIAAIRDTLPSGRVSFTTKHAR